MNISTELSGLSKFVGDKRSIEILSKAGFRYVDFTFPDKMIHDSPWFGHNYTKYAQDISTVAINNGISFNQAHAPFVYEFNEPSDIVKKILPLIQYSIIACAIMDIPRLVVHPIHHIDYAENKQYIWDINLYFYKKVACIAEEYGVQILLENMFAKNSITGRTQADFLSIPNDYKCFFDRLNDSHAFSCLVDTGHCTLTGVNPAAMIAILGKRITGTHIQDNYYMDDDHLIPFDGKINWNDVMRALSDVGYTGDISLEALHLYEGFDDSFYITRAHYLYDVGRYLLSLFEKYENEKKNKFQN